MISLSDALSEGRGVERTFNCPSPNHADVHASASVNVVLGVWHCFSCGANGTVKDHKPTIDDALKFLTGEKQERILTEDWLDIFDAIKPSPYWSNRYGEATAAYYRCGTHPMTGCPTYPIRNSNGCVLGVVERREGDPKYLYPVGVRTSTTFFGDIKHTALTAIIVEGASDVMAIHSAGILDESTICLGAYGAGLHPPQISLLRDISPKLIVLAFDNDQAGFKAAERAFSACAEICLTVIHQWEVKDPGEFDQRERKDKIRQSLDLYL